MWKPGQVSKQRAIECKYITRSQQQGAVGAQWSSSTRLCQALECALVWRETDRSAKKGIIPGSELTSTMHNGHSQQHTCAFRSIPHPLATMCAARAASLAARQVARLCESFFELCTRNFFCGLTGSSWMSTWLVLLAGMVCPSSASKSIVDSWSMLPAALWTAMHNTQATAAASPSCIFSDYVARNATCGASPAWYCAWHGACFLYPVPPTS